MVDFPLPATGFLEATVLHHKAYPHYFSPSRCVMSHRVVARLTSKKRLQFTLILCDTPESIYLYHQCETQTPHSEAEPHWTWLQSWLLFDQFLGSLVPERVFWRKIRIIPLIFETTILFVAHAEVVALKLRTNFRFSIATGRFRVVFFIGFIEVCGARLICTCSSSQEATFEVRSHAWYVQLWRHFKLSAVPFDFSRFFYPHSSFLLFILILMTFQRALIFPCHYDTNKPDIFLLIPRAGSRGCGWMDH